MWRHVWLCTSRALRYRFWAGPPSGNPTRWCVQLDSRRRLDSLSERASAVSSVPDQNCSVWMTHGMPISRHRPRLCQQQFPKTQRCVPGPRYGFQSYSSYAVIMSRQMPQFADLNCPDRRVNLGQTQTKWWTMSMKPWWCVGGWDKHRGISPMPLKNPIWRQSFGVEWFNLFDIHLKFAWLIRMDHGRRKRGPEVASPAKKSVGTFPHIFIFHSWLYDCMIYWSPTGKNPMTGEVTYMLRLHKYTSEPLTKVTVCGRYK